MFSDCAICDKQIICAQSTEITTKNEYHLPVYICPSHDLNINYYWFRVRNFESDVNLISEQANVSYSTALEAFLKHDKDIVHTIKELTQDA